jgi:hypothetical protein
LKRKGEEESQTVADCHEAGDFDYQPHSVGGEYAQVEEEEADLDEGDTDNVKKLLDIEKLLRSASSWKFVCNGQSYVENSSDLRKLKGPHIFTQACLSN